MPPARNILLIGNYLSSKGYSRSFVEELADRLEMIGWECGRASTIVSKPARMVDMIQASIRHMPRASVVHIPLFSGAAFIWAAVCAQLAAAFGTPLVISLHGGNLPAFSSRWSGSVRHVLNLAETVVAPSEYLREALRPFRDDIRLLPNPIDLIRYRFRERNPVRPRLIWLRAFHAIYNPTLAPRMLAQLLPQHPTAHLLMIGSDKGDGTLEATRRAARELGVSDHVTFQGVIQKDDVPLWLDKADIFINTTDIDNTPVSIIEAMACGLPVVTTNVGGIPNLLNDGLDAILVPRDNPAAMASAVSQLLTTPDFARDVARAARLKAEGFDWAAMIWKWDTLLLELAARSDRRLSSEHP